MTDLPPAVVVYQLHASLLESSPAIWRRLLVRSDTTIADLHSIPQIAFDWTDAHLHRFVIYGKDYGIAQLGGIGFADNPHQVRLCDLRPRINSRFRYEYDRLPPTPTSSGLAPTVVPASCPKGSISSCCGPASAN
jgi:hypothetical protein